MRCLANCGCVVGNRYICPAPDATQIWRCDEGPIHHFWCVPWLSCEQGCFQTSHGASCSSLLPSSPTPKRKARSSEIRLRTEHHAQVKRYEIANDPNENKHYICSNDGVAVLVCRWGFCSTEKLCRKGQKCDAECNCCRKIKTLDGSEKWAREKRDEVSVFSHDHLGRVVDDVVASCV